VGEWSATPSKVVAEVTQIFIHMGGSRAHA
jgi:hypothetical protein